MQKRKMVQYKTHTEILNSHIVVDSGWFFFYHLGKGGLLSSGCPGGRYSHLEGMTLDTPGEGDMTSVWLNMYDLFSEALAVTWSGIQVSNAQVENLCLLYIADNIFRGILSFFIFHMEKFLLEWSFALSGETWRNICSLFSTRASFFFREIKLVHDLCSVLRVILK